MTKLARLVSLIAISSLLFSLTVLMPIPTKAAAGTLSLLSDTMSRLAKNANSSHVIKFRTSVAVNAIADTITVTFPSDFNFTSSVYGDITLTHGASTGLEVTEALGSTPDATKWLATFSGTQSRVLTLTAPTDGVGAGSLAANDYVIITYASTYAVNPSTAGSFIVYLAVAGANTANSSVNVVTVDNDQVAVTATVDATLSFTITANSVGFGNFIGGAVRYATTDSLGSATEPSNDAPVKLSASGNGPRGLVISIQDEGNGTAAGLYNVSASEVIPAAASTAVTLSSKKYGLYGKNASTLVLDEAFDNDSAADAAVTRAPQAFASYNAVGGGSADLALKAAVDATTKPGAYTDTVTLICTGLY